jgi:sugar/nucleoside kinase (ribokinase family)
MDLASPRFLFAGQLTRDYIILPNGEAVINQPGGNALYAAIGLAVWEPDPPPGVIARVGSDYPAEWLEQIAEKGLDTRGIRTLPQEVDVRSFAAYSDRDTRSSEEVVANFARWGLPFPKDLLGFKPNTNQLCSRTIMQPVSLRQGDIPADYLDATAAHLCPIDYLTHSLLPSLLHQAEFTTITVDPAAGYMNLTYWNDIPALLTGIQAFLPSEEELLALFHGRSRDLWEMMEALAAYGCELIVVKRGERGQVLYDAGTKSHWEVPSYPARLANPIGAGDAFCGGFLAGLRRSFDPLEAVLFGNISASLVIEGNDFAYALGALPGLAEARLEALRQNIRKV